jgi:hypothetical protein
MRATIDGKTYDTEFATRLASHSGISSHEELFQTPHGEFFLWMHQIYVDGQRVASKETSFGVVPKSDSRLSCFQKIIPFTRSEAVAWCIQTQIPEILRLHIYPWA